MTGLETIKGQLRRTGAGDGCLTCGLTVPSALTWAHVHAGQDQDARRVFRLCCTCHRLYDHDIIKTDEVLRAEDAWIAGPRPKTSPLFRAITADVKAGIRVARPEVQHKGAAVRAGITVRQSNRAKRAWITRRRNVLLSQVAEVGGNPDR